MTMSPATPSSRSWPWRSGPGAQAESGFAPLLQRERWPHGLAGCARRQEATALVLEWYHAAAPTIVRDVLDQLDLAGVV